MALERRISAQPDDAPQGVGVKRRAASPVADLGVELTCQRCQAALGTLRANRITLQQRQLTLLRGVALLVIAAGQRVDLSCPACGARRTIRLTGHPLSVPAVTDQGGNDG